jgi:hypothetical protein
MNDDQSNEIELMLPAGILAELKARAEDRGATQQTLIDEAGQRLVNSPMPHIRELLTRANAIENALAEHREPSWPENFDECLEVGLVFAGLLKRDSEAYLLEAHGPEMDDIESICRMKGISYEEFSREALDAFLANKDQAPPDQADWWRNA